MNIQQQQQTVTELCAKALADGFFFANGTKYNILAPEILSGDRWKAYRKAELEMSSGMSMLQGFQGINEATVLLQNMERFGDAHIALDRLLNLQKSIQNFAETPENEVQAFCAIFCTQPDEDKKIFDSSLTAGKIKDWDAEGLPNGFFIYLAASIMRGFIELYNLTLRMTQQLNQIQPTNSDINLPPTESP